MKLHPILLIYLGRRALAPTIVGAALLAAYVLWPSAPLTGYEGVPALIVVADAAWLAVALSRSGKGEMAFLYTRGFRWDTIWWHRVLVGTIAGLLVIATSFAVLWLGLRTGVQIELGNSLYPLVARRETWVPMVWLGLYALALPTALYSAIKWDSAAPLRRLGPAFAVLPTTIYAVSADRGDVGWLHPMLLAVGVIVILTLLWTGERLHRDAEVTA